MRVRKSDKSGKRGYTYVVTH